MIIFIYGADTFRSRRKLQELKDKFVKELDPGSSSLSSLAGPNMNLGNLNEAIATGSLFVKKRMVVIENVFSHKKKEIFKELLEYFKRLSVAQAQDEQTIIIFYDQELNTKDKPLPAAAKAFFVWLNQQKYVQEFKALNNEQLSQFVKNEFKLYGKKIGSRALEHLIALTGPDLWRLHQEINKLSHYQEGSEIKPEDIAKLVSNGYEENIFALTDAFSAKNKKLALALLEEQYLAGSSPEYLLNMLYRQFKILLQIKDALSKNLNQEKISQELKIHPYVVKKAIGTVKNFSLAELKNYLDRLLLIDYLNKSGQGDIKTEINLIIAEL
ncbi:MAG: DNA polymerase III subunit delta [Patescibacteria group bacterium]